MIFRCLFLFKITLVDFSFCEGMNDSHKACLPVAGVASCAFMLFKYMFQQICISRSHDSRSHDSG